MPAKILKAVPMRTEGMVLVTEPVEGAFTLLMPEGWTNQAQLQREHSLNRVIASAIKPDQSTMIYLSDPRLPVFMEPNPSIDPSLLQFTPHMRMQPYTPAQHFFRDYLCQCFGNSPAFQITDVGESLDLQRMALADHHRAGRNAVVTSAAIGFRHVFNGKPMQCRLHGLTAGFQMVWSADMFTVSTTGDLVEQEKLAMRMMMSRHFHPGWAAAQQRLHEQRMAAGRQQAQMQNEWSRISAAGHRQRMQDIQNFGNANTQMFEDRMAQMDSSHQSWLSGQQQSDAMQQSWMQQQVQDDAMHQSSINAIREEHTVVDASGTTYQVDIHHERYFVNKHDNTYIGATAATDPADLRRTHGVNPDDYEEVKIVR